MHSVSKRRTAASKVNDPDAERGMPGNKRWIILSSQFGYVTVGRHDASNDEIRAACEQHRKHGARGWLAVMEGDYFGEMTLHMVREIAPAGQSWAEAVAAFERQRRLRNRVRPIGE